MLRVRRCADAARATSATSTTPHHFDLTRERPWHSFPRMLGTPRTSANRRASRSRTHPTRGHWLRYGERRSGDEDLAQARRPHRQRADGQQGPQARVPDGRGASRSEATHVITCGGEQSNHARATAFAAAQLGMRSVLILRTRRSRRSPPARDRQHPARPAGRRRDPVDHAAGVARAQPAARRGGRSRPRRRRRARTSSPRAARTRSAAGATCARRASSPTISRHRVARRTR